MDMSAWISDYGYWAVAFLAFWEGEIALIAASFAVHMGLLSFPAVIVSASAGALLIDHTFFLLGRQGGQRLLMKRPHWMQKIGLIHRLIEHHQVPLMLGFRFLYGLRALTLLVLGTSAIGMLRFSLLDVIAVLLWAMVMGIATYYLGSLIMHYLPQMGLLVLIAFVLLLVTAKKLAFSGKG
ncbi:MAG: DedA family protein [Gammaproteobacteria bacterium]|nr:MAG: DedA family protein [Gammaproteobacteria bacterium]